MGAAASVGDPSRSLSHAEGLAAQPLLRGLSALPAKEGLCAAGRDGMAAAAAAATAVTSLASMELDGSRQVAVRLSRFSQEREMVSAPMIEEGV